MNPPRTAHAEPRALSARDVAPRKNAEAVALDLVEPVRAARRGLGWRPQAGFDETGYATAAL
jgi:hypothetical protein